MNKAELIKSIATAAGLTQVASERAVAGFVEAVKDCLKDKDSVVLVGFGTFSLNERAPRKGRNPQTGKSIQIPAKNVVKFKAGSHLTEAINNGPY